VALKMIDAPLLGEVAQGVAGLWAIEAQGFSPDGNLLLVKAVYSDSAYPLLGTRTAFWTYDLALGRYSACINTLIASDHDVEVNDVAIAQFGGQTECVAIYRGTDATSGLDLNKLALIRNGVLVQSDLVESVSGNQADAMIDSVKVTANGRFVAIETAASNLSQNLDTNGCKDIYLFDLVLNTSRLVTTINGVESSFDSVLGDVMLGADGSLSVAFQSAQAFTAQDSNGVDDVFVWHLAQADFASANAGTIALASRTAAGAAGGSNPQLNLNGLLFNSESGAFSSLDLNNASDVWQSGAALPALVSAAATGTLTEQTTLASTSDGGRYVALVTASPEIAGSTQVDQLVVVDTVTHSKVIVSQSASGALADDAVITPVLSADGTRVAFSSQASNLGNAAPDGQMHLYVSDLQTTADRTECGKSVDLLAYSWKAHTLLDGVSVSAGAHSGTTEASGVTSFVAVTEPSLSLTASRAVPAAEVSATSSAVNLQDAIAILKMIVGLPVNGAGQALSPYQALAADFNGDGTVGLTDAIGVLKHVVGLTAPDPTWHFVSETDPTVPGKANLIPGLPQSAVPVDLSATSPLHVGLVGYLSGDVDGSYAGAPGAADLDVTQPGYIATLVGSHPELSLAQFGV